MNPQNALRISAKSLVAILTFGCTAVFGAQPQIVINEIMYHPPNDRNDLQYVELFNRGASAASLSGWKFSKGISFVFPDGTTVGPGEFIVICHNREAFSSFYTNAVHIVGNFSGVLSHHGEKIELSDKSGKVIDAVKFSDHASWPLSADGYGASLERICPDAKSSLAENWTASTLPRTHVPAGTPGTQNDSFSTNLPPKISKVQFSPFVPSRPVSVTAQVRDSDGVTNVTLLYHTASTRSESADSRVEMQLDPSDSKRATYVASIPPQPDGSVVRFRIRAVDSRGTERISPAENDLRPTYSYYCGLNTNTAQIPFGFAIQVGAAEGRTGFRRVTDIRTNTEPTRGTAVFIYMLPQSKEVQLFDHVRLQPRVGGFKLHFQNDQTLRRMSSVNIIFEASPRYALAEPLGYEVFRMAGVPAEQTEHIRIWHDGVLAGYRLLIEQPNKSFLARHKRNDNGNLYKLLWYGHDVTSKHEKKTHIFSGHQDLLDLLDRLDHSTNQWEVIQKNFNVDEVAGYFAACMCIENWDGFHNNYFAYHDTEGTGKWEMYPWDLDKTWGDYDGSPPEHDWCEMPLTYGMTGDVSPPSDPGSRHNHRGAFGGVEWWRNGGYFAGPLLVNPQFRKVFLKRLRDLCETKFTPQNFGPVIDALETKLEPEVRIRAAAHRESEAGALAQFQRDIASLRYQVEHRRKFILQELDKNPQ